MTRTDFLHFMDSIGHDLSHGQLVPSTLRAAIESALTGNAPPDDCPSGLRAALAAMTPQQLQNVRTVYLEDDNWVRARVFAT